MIHKSEVIPVGQILKTHGVKGEMQFSFTSPLFEDEELSYIVIDVDGIFVPFFLSEYRLKSSSAGLLTLEGIESEELARQFVGKTVYVSSDYIEVIKDQEIGLSYYVGFTLIDTEFGRVGVISEIDDSTENVLFVVQSDNEELLIPAGEDYIQKINHNTKEILVILPAGLLDL